tara:strand:- start:276 stop:518 length:243 start_codon:yes stop_codon:yes gene_type:complete
MHTINASTFYRTKAVPKSLKNRTKTRHYSLFFNKFATKKGIISWSQQGKKTGPKHAFLQRQLCEPSTSQSRRVTGTSTQK